LDDVESSQSHEHAFDDGLVSTFAGQNLELPASATTIPAGHRSDNQASADVPGFFVDIKFDELIQKHDFRRWPILLQKSAILSVGSPLRPSRSVLWPFSHWTCGHSIDGSGIRH
jgi:hypothetical protein